MLPKVKRTSHSRTPNASQLHLNNLNYEKDRNNSGMIGQRYSRTIDHLIAEVENKTKQLALLEPTNVPPSAKEQHLESQITALIKQQANLKHEMTRVSEMAKHYKQSKIEAETKYQNLSKEFGLAKTAISSLQSKIDLLLQVNACLITVTGNSLEVFPQYEEHWRCLTGSIYTLKEELRTANIQEGLTAFSPLQTAVKKIQNFNTNLKLLQNYKRKLIASISQIHHSTKSTEECLAMIEAIGVNDLSKLKQSIADLSRTTSTSEPHHREQSISYDLRLSPQQIGYKIIPESNLRLQQILSSISAQFEQHIHLVESQKMQYQFVKNKKLIASQKYECEICQKYEKIVSQIFCISRKAYKEIKFEFLKEIQGVEDIKEISLLI